MKKVVVYLMLAVALGTTACNNDVDGLAAGSNLLDVSFNVTSPNSRALITDEYLPEGSRTGALLVGEGYDEYANICFTATGSEENQTWKSDNVYLNSNAATLYSYYPYSVDADVSALQIETASQTDYMYGTPLTTVSAANPSVTVALNHALTNVSINLLKGNYTGEGKISSVSVMGEGIATGGTFNAAQAVPAFTSYNGVGTAVARNVTATMGTPIDIMVVSTGVKAPVQFSVVVDGVTYTSSSSDIILAEGLSYSYTFNLNTTKMNMLKSGVTKWGVGQITDNGPLDMNAGTSKDAWQFLGNGVYAVSAEGNPVPASKADETCKGVVLVVNDTPTRQMLMIGETGSLQAEWGPIWSDVAGLANVETVNGTNTGGYFNATAQPFLSTDYTTWTKGALADFAGKANSALLPTGNEKYLGDRLKSRNDSKTEGYNDWYVPACGQMGLIYVYMTDINKVRVAIGQSALKESSITNFYWTSTERGENDAYCISLFKQHYITALSKACSNFQMTYDGAVIYVRDMVAD